jgi:hypothetical protein
MRSQARVSVLETKREGGISRREGAALFNDADRSGKMKTEN